MEVDLTERQKLWFDLAAMHTDDFATRAEQHDRPKTFPVENTEATKASGYSNMTFPPELGGSGTSILDVLSVLERGEVALETTTSSSPGVFKPIGSDSYIHVVMPMYTLRCGA